MSWEVDGGAFRAAGAAWRGVAWANEREIPDEKFTVLVRSFGRAVKDGWL